MPPKKLAGAANGVTACDASGVSQQLVHQIPGQGQKGAGAKTVAHALGVHPGPHADSDAKCDDSAPLGPVKGKRGRPGKANAGPSATQGTAGQLVGNKVGEDGEHDGWLLPKATIKGKRGRKRNAAEGPVVDPSPDPRGTVAGAGECSTDMVHAPSAEEAGKVSDRGVHEGSAIPAKRQRTSMSVPPTTGKGGAAEGGAPGTAAGGSAGPPGKGAEGGQRRTSNLESDAANGKEKEDTTGQATAETRVEVSPLAQLEWQVRGLVLESVQPSKAAESGAGK